MPLLREEGVGSPEAARCDDIRVGEDDLTVFLIGVGDVQFLLRSLSEGCFIPCKIPGTEKFPARLESGLIQCFSALGRQIEVGRLDPLHGDHDGHAHAHGTGDVLVVGVDAVVLAMAGEDQQFAP
jgi:hypothetical protein